VTKAIREIKATRVFVGLLVRRVRRVIKERRVTRVILDLLEVVGSFSLIGRLMLLRVLGELMRITFTSRAQHQTSGISSTTWERSRP
jgi:hypothetical protein